ncbi:aspartate/glutamate racemase family protein [Microbacterium sp. ZW T5_56]|uniref:aspartate/glutamate racemase family protein n=1 Tax=Microbacterium sp. ZW T5_56 TaxID=3378081 RepID=UPI003851AC88
MSVRVGVLHTVPALVPVFDDLLRSRRPDLEVVHVVDGTLLSRAIAGGITDDVRADLRQRLSALRAAGATAVLVTCSSIGEAATDAAAEAGVDLTRVDAAMARDAVARAAGGQVLVLATLTATLGPTTRLVRAAADAAGHDISVVSRLVDGAAAARADGDQDRHDRLIAAAVATAGDADVVVLAQASMAAGAGDDPRVMTSPSSGVDAFVAGLP